VYELAPIEDTDWDEDEEAPLPPGPTPVEDALARKRSVAQLGLALGGFIVARLALERGGVFDEISVALPGWEIPAHVFIQGALALALTWLALRLYRDGAVSIGLAKPRRPWLEIGRGFMLVGGIYVVMVPLMLATMLLIRGPARESMVQQKTEVLRVVAQIPLAALFPSAVMAGVYEEVFVRGLLQSRVAKVFAGAKPQGLALRLSAVLIASVLFGLGHLYQGPVGVMQTTVVGVILGVSAVVWRSIWPAVVAHVVIDTVGLLVSRVLLPATQGLLQRS
jgi:membrane protease YdiL (CAAX protease family)